jgi:photosystem II stability/assembly factor-like uncharacterized protein
MAIATSKITQGNIISGIIINDLNNPATINMAPFTNLNTLEVRTNNINTKDFNFNNFPNINYFSSDGSDLEASSTGPIFQMIGNNTGVKNIQLDNSKLTSIIFKNPQNFTGNIKLSTIPTGLNYFDIGGNRVNGDSLATLLVSFSGMTKTYDIKSGYLDVAPEVTAQSLQPKNPDDNSEYTDAWISPDGKYQLISQLDEFTPPNTTRFGNIWLSTDFGISFNTLNNFEGLTNGRNFWRSVSASSGIKYICAVQRNGKAYLSSDSGVSFNLINTGSTTRNEKMDYTDCAMSSDGKYINLTATYTPPTYASGNVFLSSDFGASFRTIAGATFPVFPYVKNQTNVKWRSTSMSSDGRYQNICIAGDNAGNVYVSNDFGTSWTRTNLGGFFGLTETFRDIATSSNGQYMSANGNAIYTSENYGVNWKTSYIEDKKYRLGYGFYILLPDADFNGGISMSSDGKYQVSCLTSKVATKYVYIAPITYYIPVKEPGFILTSSNYGKSWSKLNFRDYWGCVALSPDAQHLLIGSESGQFYTSRTDGADTVYGSNFSTAYSAANWLRDQKDWEVTYVNNFFS